MFQGNTKTEGSFRCLLYREWASFRKIFKFQVKIHLHVAILRCDLTLRFCCTPRVYLPPPFQFENSILIFNPKKLLICAVLNKIKLHWASYFMKKPVTTNLLALATQGGATYEEAVLSVYSKTMFLDLNQVYYWGFNTTFNIFNKRIQHTIITTI